MTSRIARKPITVPKGVDVMLQGQMLTIKGVKGSLDLQLREEIRFNHENDQISITPANEERFANAMTGTTAALIGNMVKGVSEGFERKMKLVGVGYRAQAQGKKLNLTLGFSHPVVFDVPEGLTIETPSNTEIVIKGVDKQLVGQAAANIRAYRPPEPYKGKGIRYEGEEIILKETKKK